MTDISHLDFDPSSAAGQIQAWLVRPVRDLLPELQRTKDKPLAELTVSEALGWVAAGTYFVMIGLLAAELGGNVLAVLLRGPARR